MMKTILPDDVHVYLIKFPSPGNEMVCENEDGTWTILINNALSHEGQLEAYNHAMEHIKNGDHEKASVQQIELEAHGIKPKELIEQADTIEVPVEWFNAILEELAYNRLLQELYEEEIERLRLQNRYSYARPLAEYDERAAFNALEDRYLYGGL